jgi:hypothetical protein
MKSPIVTTFLILLLASPSLCMAAQEGWGAWEDDGASNVYEFLPNNEFRFGGVQRVWVPNAHIWPFRPSQGWARGQHIPEWHTFSGAWQAGEGICAQVEPNGERAIGNLKIYVASLDCCMEAKRLGNALILRSLSVKGEGPPVCANRALRERGTSAEESQAEGSKQPVR